MADDPMPAWADAVAASEAMRLALTPPELHGAACGWLAGGGAPARVGEAWDLDAETGPLDPRLAALVASTHRQLEDPGFGLQLLLPDDGATVALRADALFDWCRAFLGGFGLAAGATPPLSEEANEALADLARLAAAEPDAGEGDGEAEALAEIEEFVRVAVLLLHGDCVLATRRRRDLH